MKYTIETDHTHRIVTCVFEGTLNTEIAWKATGELNRKALDLKYNKLYDVSGAQPSASLGDTYFFPRQLQNEFDYKEYKNLKIAIYFTDEGDREFWEFFKNTSQNVGYTIEIFRSRYEAVAWLTR
jgi:hypothetical protein